MSTPENDRRMAKKCHELAKRSLTLRGQPRGPHQYLMALADRFEQDAQNAEQKAFTGDKPQGIGPIGERR